MGPPIYDHPGLTLDELPWVKLHNSSRYADIIVDGVAHRVYMLSGLKSFQIYDDPYVATPLYACGIDDRLVQAAFIIELTKGRTVTFVQPSSNSQK